MSHARQKIRDAVAAALAELPVKEIYTNSSQRFNADKLPSIRIRTDTESIETYHRDGQQERDLTVTIILCDKSGAQNVTDRLDDLCLLVEQSMSTASIGRQTSLTSMSYQDSPEGAEDYAFLSIDYSIIYYTTTSNPQEIQ